jgi:hypothetical protein
MTQYQWQELVFVRLCVDEKLVPQLTEIPLGFRQKISKVKGETIVDVDMYLTVDFVQWIQGMGSSVEVIHPPEFRELIRQELEQTIHQYRLV